MKNYHTLLFDLDNTLLDFTQSELLSLQHIHEKYLMDYISEQELIKTYRQINVALWEYVSKGHLTPKDVKEQRFLKLVDYHRLPVCPHEMKDSYSNHLAISAHWYPGAKEALDALRDDYAIGIITNGLTLVQKKKCELSGISDWCECIIISEEVGLAKPDVRIFELAFEKLNVKAHDCLMIGDSISSDYQGAINCGMDFCWITDTPQQLPNNMSKPRYTLSSTAALLDIL